MKKINPELKLRSKKLRRKETHTEKIIWNSLRDRRFTNFKFKRQHVIESYIVDFVCLHKKLVIEIDGESHLFSVQYDKKRTRYLESLGYRVLRFDNEAVMGNAEFVLEEILEALMA